MLDSLCFLLPQTGDIRGRWVRVGDDFEGCQVEVVPGNGELIARLVSVPSPMRLAGWSPGDWKWRQITALSDGRVSLLDARKRFDPNRQALLDIDYVPYVATFGLFDRLRFADPAPSSPTAQIWKRLAPPGQA